MSDDCNAFARKFAEETNRTPPQCSDAAAQALRNYYWPGNVRELGNLMQRLVVVALAEVEIEHIRNVLAGVDGNKTRAAEILGIDRKTLREKLKQHESNSH